MMEMITFHLIFPNVVGFRGGGGRASLPTPFSKYILSETRIMYI